MKKAYEILHELSEAYGMNREWFKAETGEINDKQLVALQALQAERAIAAQEKQAEALERILIALEAK